MPQDPAMLERAKATKSSIPELVIQHMRRTFLAQAPPLNSPSRWDIYLSGMWMMKELLHRGADPDAAHGACFAMGQRQAMLDEGEDVWVVAVACLDAYDRGEVDVPGDELARRLIVEKFGKSPDRKEVARWALAKLNRLIGNRR